MTFAPTRDVTTYYEEQGSGPAVILIHGHGADRRIWGRQAPALVRAGYRVLRYDVRGHGRSSIPQSGYTWDDYSADLKALVDQLAVPRAHVVGLSMGGGIALQFALDHPPRVLSLTLIDSSLPGFGYSGEMESTIEELRDAVRREGPRKAFERLWLPHPMFDGVRRFPDRFAFLREIVLAYPAADYLDDTPYVTPQHQAIDRLGDVSVPTLVMVGELDIPDFQLIAEVLAENIPGAEKRVVPDAGHLPPLEQPDEVNRLLVFFGRSGSVATEAPRH
jgi:3-oxoadipate enol-lactonase